jgi:hypothetical protein
MDFLDCPRNAQGRRGKVSIGVLADYALSLNR